MTFSILMSHFLPRCRIFYFAWCYLEVALAMLHFLLLMWYFLTWWHLCYVFYLDVPCSTLRKRYSTLMQHFLPWWHFFTLMKCCSKLKSKFCWTSVLDFDSTLMIDLILQSPIITNYYVKFSLFPQWTLSVNGPTLCYLNS